MADLSFVIPAYNEKAFLAACLGAITKLAERNNLDAQIVVIDNGSTDQTPELAKQYTDQVISIERQSVSAARNVGIKQASSELIAFIDADVVLTQAWFDCFMKNKAGYLAQPLFLSGHQYAVRPQGTWIERYWFKNIKDKLLNGGNIITSKTLCERIGGFDETLKTSEDYDFCQRAIDAGADYSTDAGYVAIHEGFPRDVKNFYRRENWHGEGDYRTLRSFLASIAAILGVGYLGAISLLAVLIIAGFWHMALLLLGLLLLLNFAVTLKRFSGVPFTDFMANYALHFAYFIARGMSLFKALNNRRNRY